MENNNRKSFWKGALTGALVMLFIVIGGMSIWRLAEKATVSFRSLSSQSGTQKTEGVDTKAEAEAKLGVLGELIDNYYLYMDDVDEQDLIDGLYAGYVSGLGDPYTVYYNEEETAALLESSSGEYSGVGAVLMKDQATGGVAITEVYEDSPAETAGLKVGDIIFQVDEKKIGDEDLSEIVTWIKGEEGTEVTLHVYRNGEEKSLTAVRGRVEAKTVTYEMKDEEIGYIKVSEFDDVTLGQFQSALKDLENQGMKGLVIDLRANPGGNLDTVVDMLKLICPKGILVSTEDRAGNTTEYKNEKDSGFDLPLSVLVNGYSASASEIFAGAVQDYEVGEIVGTTSYGKGIVQQIFDLRDGSSLKVTISEYFTPSGRCIHGKGITPDVEIEYEADEQDASKDNQLEKAMEVVREEL